MKAYLMAGAALAILTGGALAQSAAPPAPPAPPAQVGVATPPPAQPGDTISDAGPGTPPPPPGLHPKRPPPPGAAGTDGPGGPPPPPGGGHRPPPPPPSRAAHFHLERGDTLIDVKCADDDPLKVCADLTIEMLDKLASLPRP